jgi:hypothetical protein
MSQKDPAELRKRLEAGEWLRPGDVAIAMGLSRSTVHRLLDDGQIGWKLRPGGKQRWCDPKDVVRLLREAEETRRGEMP